MWAKIITIKRTKDLNYFSLCAFNLFNKRVSQCEMNYWNKWTSPRHSNLLRCTCRSIKGSIHPKMKIVINYPLSCRSRAVRPSFIFRTQIKIFLMKSESYLTLHRQQLNWKVPRSRNVVNTSVKQWHQWLNFSFATLQEYFFVQRKQK